MDLPTFPHCSCLSARTLLRLLDGHAITHRDFQIICASYRLSARVYDLRNNGWLVDDRWEKGLTNDPAGRIARFKRYWLSPEVTSLIKGDKVFSNRVEKFKKLVRNYEQKKTPKH